MKRASRLPERRGRQGVARRGRAWPGASPRRGAASVQVSGQVRKRVAAGTHGPPALRVSGPALAPGTRLGAWRAGRRMQVSGHSPGPCARPHCLQAWPLHVRQVVLVLGGPQVAASLVPCFLASRHSQSADRRGTGPGATSAWRTLGLRPGGPRPPTRVRARGYHRPRSRCVHASAADVGLGRGRQRPHLRDSKRGTRTCPAPAPPLAQGCCGSGPR